MNIDKYYDNHKCCPKCDSDMIEQTTAGVGVFILNNELKDTINRAICCNCKWSGKVHDLMPNKKNPTEESK